MPRGQLKTYKIGNRSYSITQLLDFGGVREIVSSQGTEGSKRELLRDLLRKNVITSQMLTNQGAAGLTQKVREEVIVSFDKLKWEESGLTLSYIESGEVTFIKMNNSGKAGHFASLPKYLRIKNAIINIQNKDEYCFKWAITRALNLERAQNVRITPFFKGKGGAIRLVRNYFSCCFGE